MDVLFTCKYEEDPIKTGGARVLTRLYINISDAQGRNLRCPWSNPANIQTQAFMVVLVTCKNEGDPIKNEGAIVLTRFSPL